MKKSFAYCIVLLSLFGCANCLISNNQTSVSVSNLTAYTKWRNSNKRVYLNSDEKLFRQAIFFENLKKINDHNSNPKSTYTAGTNQFSDMTQEEFVNRVLTNNISQGVQNQTNTVNTNNTIQNTTNLNVNGSSIDWRTKGAVQAIKDQGQCGSCWTFATSALMESYNFIKNGKLLSFAEQQLLDCVNSANGYSSQGCNGGYPQQALQYAVKFGIEQSRQYPYTGVQGKCQVKNATTGYYPKTFQKLPNTVNALKNALNNSPVSVAIDATKLSRYSSGIYVCNQPVSVNHVALAIGYDANGNWIIKNSWGTSWGQNGFMTLASGATCGILTENYIITS